MNDSYVLQQLVLMVMIISFIAVLIRCVIQRRKSPWQMYAAHTVGWTYLWISSMLQAFPFLPTSHALAAIAFWVFQTVFRYHMQKPVAGQEEVQPQVTPTSLA